MIYVYINHLKCHLLSVKGIKNKWKLANITKRVVFPSVILVGMPGLTVLCIDNVHTRRSLSLKIVHK
jgi:hypothetical protein